MGSGGARRQTVSDAFCVENCAPCDNAIAEVSGNQITKFCKNQGCCSWPIAAHHNDYLLCYFLYMHYDNWLCGTSLGLYGISHKKKWQHGFDSSRPRKCAFHTGRYRRTFSPTFDADHIQNGSNTASSITGPCGPGPSIIQYGWADTYRRCELWTSY